MSQDEKEDLVKEYINLVYYAIGKMHLRYRLDELVDVGMIGLTRGINTFDKSRNIKLTTYLYACICNEIKRYLKVMSSAKRQGKVISLDTEIDDNTTLGELIGEDPEYDNNLINDEIMNRIIKRVSKLNEKWQHVFYFTWGINGYDKLNQIDIGKLVNLSQTQISRINIKIIRMLKYEFREYF